MAMKARVRNYAYVSYRTMKKEGAQVCQFDIGMDDIWNIELKF